MIHDVQNTKEIKDILGIEDKVIILNFHSETCGPCIMQMPILEDLSNDLKLILLTFDVDNDHDNTLKQFNVSSTPTTLIYKNNNLKFSNTGFLSYEEWKDELSKLL